MQPALTASARAPARRAALTTTKTTTAAALPCRRPPGRRRAAPPALARARGGGDRSSAVSPTNTNATNKQRAHSPVAVADSPTPPPLLSLRRRLAGALPPALTSLAADAQEAAAAAAAAAKRVAARVATQQQQQQQQQQRSSSPSPSSSSSPPSSWGGLGRLGFLSGGGEQDEQQQSVATASAAAPPSPPPPASPRPASPTASASSSSSQQQQQQQQEDRRQAATTTTNNNTSNTSSTDWWSALPSRHRVVVGAALAFVVCNMDKVNMSVAIIPMAQEYGWSAGVAGLVQSAFFWGYILCQLPGGYLSSAIGGRNVMPAGVGLWSLATAAVPLLAGTVPGLCAARAAVGLGEAVAPSAATDMVARIVPPGERSRAVAFVFGGLHVGSVLGLLAAPWLIERLGWESVFVSFGAVGLVWCVWFERLMAELRESDPEVAARLVGNGVVNAGGGGGLAGAMATADEADAVASPLASSAGAAHHHPTTTPSLPHIPYRAFLRSTSVQALAYAHFCNNWFHYTMLAWLPTYFTSALDADLGSAARTALLPPLAGIAASALAGPLADGLVARGMPVSRVRKLAQGAAFLVPSACLLAASALAGGVDDAAADAAAAASAADVDMWAARVTVGLITAGLGASSFSLAGLYCTHQDLSPKYSSAMLGLTNTAGAVPGIVGVAATGWLYDATGSWAAALFLPTVFFLVTGAGVFTFFGSNAPEDFDAPGLDVPFAVEAPLRRAAARAAGVLPAGPARARAMEMLGLSDEEVEELTERKER